jgi:hypothetical protein
VRTALADALPSADDIEVGLENGTIRVDRILTGLSELPPWGEPARQEAT